MAIEGPLREHVIAFAREHADEVVVVLAVRCIAGWLDRDTLRMPAARWRDTIVRVPPARSNFVDAISRRSIASVRDAIPLEDAFETLPLALLTRAT
jgi:maltooligosyltrehalose synthase